ncbi:hypothetical protein AAY473_040634, partial [Plecturocebus cupreus]
MSLLRITGQVSAAVSSSASQSFSGLHVAAVLPCVLHASLWSAHWEQQRLKGARAAPYASGTTADTLVLALQSKDSGKAPPGLGATSQAVVTQEASLSTAPGGPLTLSCGCSAGAVITSTLPAVSNKSPVKSISPGSHRTYLGSLASETFIKSLLTFANFHIKRKPPFNLPLPCPLDHYSSHHQPYQCEAPTTMGRLQDSQLHWPLSDIVSSFRKEDQDSQGSPPKMPQCVRGRKALRSEDSVGQSSSSSHDLSPTVLAWSSEDTGRTQRKAQHPSR